MRPREPRRRVMIRARMRDRRGWRDACILNMSSRGLMCQSATPPPRGEVFELRRGVHVVIGRVVWSSEHRFGVRTQDRVPMDAIVAEPTAAAAALNDDSPLFERRRSSRSVVTLDARQRGRMMEWALALVGLLALAGIAVDTVDHTLAKPMEQVEAALVAH